MHGEVTDFGGRTHENWNESGRILDSELCHGSWTAVRGLATVLICTIAVWFRPMTTVSRSCPRCGARMIIIEVFPRGCDVHPRPQSQDRVKTTCWAAGNKVDEGAAQDGGLPRFSQDSQNIPLLTSLASKGQLSTASRLFRHRNRYSLGLEPND